MVKKQKKLKITKAMREQILKEHKKQLMDKTTLLKDFIDDLEVTPVEVITMFELIKGFLLRK